MFAGEVGCGWIGQVGVTGDAIRAMFQKFFP